MSLALIIAVTLGVIFGYVFTGSQLTDLITSSSPAILAILLFSVGIDIGRSKDSFKDVKKHLKGVTIVTISTIVGSLSAGMLAASIFSMPLSHGAAVASGFGWYSLSGVLLTNLGNAQLGSVAFLSNVAREVIAVISIPYLAKHLGKYAAIGPSGATSMDTTLPVISANTDESTAIVAFLNGVILSFLVPVLVPLIYNIKF